MRVRIIYFKVTDMEQSVTFWEKARAELQVGEVDGIFTLRSSGRAVAE